MKDFEQMTSEEKKEYMENLIAWGKANNERLEQKERLEKYDSLGDLIAKGAMFIATWIMLTLTAIGFSMIGSLLLESNGPELVKLLSVPLILLAFGIFFSAMIHNQIFKDIVNRNYLLLRASGNSKLKVVIFGVLTFIVSFFVVFDVLTYKSIGTILGATGALRIIIGSIIPSFLTVIIYNIIYKSLAKKNAVTKQIAKEIVSYSTSLGVVAGYAFIIIFGAVCLSYAYGSSFDDMIQY